MDIVAIFVNLVVSIIALLWQSFLFAIPVFFIGLVAVFVGKKLIEKYNFSWFAAALLSTFLIVTFIVFVIYFYPLLVAEKPTIGILPEYFQRPLTEVVAQAILIPLRLLLVSFILTLLLLPLEFVASFIYDKINATSHNYYIAMFGSAFFTVLFAWILILFIFPKVIGFDILSGAIYMIYYGFAYF